jgi:hypothetical protein
MTEDVRVVSALDQIAAAMWEHDYEADMARAELDDWAEGGDD